MNATQPCATTPTFSPVSIPSLTNMTLGQGTQDFGTAAVEMFLTALRFLFGILMTVHNIVTPNASAAWTFIKQNFVAAWNFVEQVATQQASPFLFATWNFIAQFLIGSWNFFGNFFSNQAQPFLFNKVIPFLNNAAFNHAIPFLNGVVIPYIRTTVIPGLQVGISHILQLLQKMLETSNQTVANGIATLPPHAKNSKLDPCSAKFFLWMVLITSLVLIRVIPSIKEAIRTKWLNFKKRFHHLCARLFPEWTTTHNPTNGPRNVPEHLITENVSQADLQVEPFNGIFTINQAQNMTHVTPAGKTKKVSIIPTYKEAKQGWYPSTQEKASEPINDKEVARMQTKFQAAIDVPSNPDQKFVQLKAAVVNELENVRGKKGRNTPAPGQTIKDISYVHNHNNNVAIAHQKVTNSKGNQAKLEGYSPFAKDLGVTIAQRWEVSWGNKRRRLANHNGGVANVDREMYQPPAYTPNT